MTDAVADPEGLKAVIRDLLDGWSTEAGSVDLGQRNRRPDPGRFVAIHSLAAHVHRLGGAALMLSDAERPLEAMPLVRLAFESAITAMWLAQNEEGGRAFVNEFGRQQRAMRQALLKSSNPTFASGGNDLPYVDASDLHSNSDVQARAFQQMCEDFNGGTDLYIYYRLMSSYSHPGVRLVEEYIVPTDDGDDVKGLLNVPRFSPNGMWLFMLAASLIWAGTAFDYIEVTRKRRSELRTAARTIGVVRDLQLTPTATARSSKRAPRKA